MHKSILVSHCESLVVDNEYAAIVTKKVFINTIVTIAQDIVSITHC